MFEEVEFPETGGLRALHLTGLPQIVILAGPNGAGKSRLLRVLREQTYAEAGRRFSLEVQLEQLRSGVVRPPRLRGQPSAAPIEAEIHRIQLRLAGSNHSRFRRSTGVAHTPPILIATEAIRSVAQQAAEAMPFGQYAALSGMQVAFDASVNFGSMGLFFAGLAQVYYQAKHPDHERDPALKEALGRAEVFNSLIADLLGRRVGYELAGGIARPTFGSAQFNAAVLSPGEKTLIAWAMCLHANSYGQVLPSDAIILIDEPELHLHPAACTDILERLRTKVIDGTNRQLWLATHSPSVLSHIAPFGAVYVVRANEVKRAAPGLIDAMDGLLGSGGRQVLGAFLKEAGEAEFACFLAQSLENALVSDRTGDRQSDQFTRVAASRLKQGRTLRILDYASGKGRFARAIADLPEPVRLRFDYYAYDDRTRDHHRPERERQVRALYPDELTPEIRCSNEITEFTNDRRVDVVVFANFLHEVPPQRWQHHLRRAWDALSDDGILLVLEDQRISVGELPHKGGFIVLDLGDMRRLLGSTGGVDSFSTNDERCSAVVVNRTALETSREDGAEYRERLRNTLLEVKRRSADDVRRARENTSAAGRSHARAVVQLANVTLALEDFYGN
jgi:SAM-dependent methyltransferase